MSRELRIPSRLLGNALADKNVKGLRLLACAKLEGHRANIKDLCACLKIQPKTCRRLAQKIIDAGWAGFDGTFLFPRSWRRLKCSNGGGLYLTIPGSFKILKDLKRFEALCFAQALKRFYQKQRKKRKLSRQQWVPHSSTRRVMQRDFPARYLCKSLHISERRFERLKASAASYKFISVKPQARQTIGRADELPEWIKAYPDRPFIKSRKGWFFYTPEVSKISVRI
jgi:hypothetical protein